MSLGKLEHPNGLQIRREGIASPRLNDLGFRKKAAGKRPSKEQSASGRLSLQIV